MNIFELTQEWLTIMDMIAEAEGEVTEEIELLLNKIEGSAAQKLTNMRYIIQAFQAKIDANNKEIERLEKNVKSSEKAIDRMKNTMIVVLKIIGSPEISKTSGELTYKLNTDFGNYSTRPTVKLEGAEDLESLYNNQTLIDNGLVKKVITLEVNPSREKELIGLIKDDVTNSTIKLDRKELLSKLKDKTIEETEDYKINKSSYQLRM
jgi:hypothetical protein